jgi:hypothetical protein
MSFNANDSPITGGGKKRTPDLEPGTYPARLNGVSVLGIQKQREYKGEPKPPKLELSLTYEFLDEFLLDEDGNIQEDKPLFRSETMPSNRLTAEKAKSTARYLALDPKEKHEGDWFALVGTPCTVTLVLESFKDRFGQPRTKNKITAVSAMRPKEAERAGPLVNPPRLFNFYEPDMEVYESFPDWIKEKLQGALDFPGSKLEAALQTSAAPKTTKTTEASLKDDEKFLEDGDDNAEDDKDW